MRASDLIQRLLTVLFSEGNLPVWTDQSQEADPVHDAEVRYLVFEHESSDLYNYQDYLDLKYQPQDPDEKVFKVNSQETYRHKQPGPQHIDLRINDLIGKLLTLLQQHGDRVVCLATFGEEESPLEDIEVRFIENLGYGDTSTRVQASQGSLKTATLIFDN